MTYLDIWDQQVVTEFIRRRWKDIRQNAGGGEDFRTDGETILPLVSHNGRHATITIQDVKPVGMAPFKAPGATPALWTRKPNLRQETIELVDIDELHRIDPIDMLKLKSPDPNLVAEVTWSLADRGAEMQDRNDLRTEWMRWQALGGTLVVNYPNAGAVTIDYGIPVGNFPTAGVDWDDFEDSDPIEDLWATSSVALAHSGVYLPWYHMNSNTWRVMRRSESLRDQLSSYGRNTYLPSEKDIKELSREGTDFKIVDSGYHANGDAATDLTLTHWIPDGKVFVTTANYMYANRRIGEVLDGWVLVGQPGQEQPVARQGSQSEWIYNRMGQQTFLRQASARMVRLTAPGAIAWLTAYTP